MEKGGIKPTRGDGLLEGFLAKKRAGMAAKLIPPNLERADYWMSDAGHFPIS